MSIVLNICVSKVVKTCFNLKTIKHQHDVDPTSHEWKFEEFLYKKWKFEELVMVVIKGNENLSHECSPRQDLVMDYKI